MAITRFRNENIVVFIIHSSMLPANRQRSKLKLDWAAHGAFIGNKPSALMVLQLCMENIDVRFSIICWIPQPKGMLFWDWMRLHQNQWLNTSDGNLYNKIAHFRHLSFDDKQNISSTVAHSTQMAGLALSFPFPLSFSSFPRLYSQIRCHFNIVIQMNINKPLKNL